jgi:hypothetical protein
VPPDLFDGTEAVPPADLVVRLVDRDPCDCGCDLAVIAPSKHPHAGELKCSECRSHRGWIPREAFAFVQETIQRFGIPPEPIVIRKREKAMTYDNTDKGALFRNDRKDDDRDPDYRGNINVDGVEYWLSAWLKVSKDGKKYMSLSVKPKNESNGRARQQKSGGGGAPYSDDIPFNAEWR